MFIKLSPEVSRSRVSRPQQIITIGHVYPGIDVLLAASSPGAFHNSGERFDSPKCHPNTRTHRGVGPHEFFSQDAKGGGWIHVP